MEALPTAQEWVRAAGLEKVGSREWCGPCPICGGDDRFHVSEKDGRALVGCRWCIDDRPEAERAAGFREVLRAAFPDRRPISGTAPKTRAPSGDMVMALPAASWDVHGAGADPLAWRYRVDLAGPSGSITRELPAEAVLHIRLADPRTPWQGRSPLTRCKATADLAARIESSLDKEARIPPTRIAPAPVATNEQVKGYGDGLRAGGVLATFWGTGMPGGEQLPSSRWTPAKMQPEPDQVMHSLRTQTGHDIAGAFGVPATLLESRGDGSAQREAWRRLWAGTMQPLAMLLQDELRLKLDSVAEVSLASLRASDEDGRSRAVSRRAAAAKTFFDMGVERGEALRLAGVDQ